MRQEMRVVASFGDDPTKIEVILPTGDPQLMLPDVAAKPNFQLFGTTFSYSYPEEELAKRPAQPANTLVEMGTPYCFHVPNNAMFELKEAGATSYLVFKKVWTGRAEDLSSADYRSPDRVLYHNKTSIRTPNFPTDPGLGPEPICTGVNVEALKDKTGLYRYSLVWMFLDTAYPRETLTSKAGSQAAT